MLRFERPPGTLPHPEPCLVVGQGVEVLARAAGDAPPYAVGLLARDSRGVLFAFEEGASGLLQELDLPLTVEALSGGCPEQPDAATVRQAQMLAFVSGDRRVDLFTGQWGLLPVAEGYDLALLNLRSFVPSDGSDTTGFAWVGLAMAGSDGGACW